MATATLPSGGSTASGTEQQSVPQPAQKDHPRAGWRRWAPFRVCASLQLAIVLLTLFASCLALATLLESAYSAGIARDLIYRTWWFALLLTLLAVNVLCAAIKKYPWKKHQIGFLITHAGLLVLLLGGLLTNVAGTEGQMLLVDTNDRSLQQKIHMSNQADTIQLTDQHRLEIYLVPENPSPDHPALKAMTAVLEGGIDPSPKMRKHLRKASWSLDFAPGTLAWQTDEHFQPKLPWNLQFLSTLANPFPGYQKQLGREGTLTIHNFYPHTESWPVRKANPSSANCAGLRIKLHTSMTPIPLDRWVNSTPTFQRDPGPLGLDLMLLDEPALLKEFLQPPDWLKAEGNSKPVVRRKRGELVLALGARPHLCRVNLDTLTLGKSVALERPGWTLTLQKCGNLLDLLGKQANQPQGIPAHYPAVVFELSAHGKKGEFVACARLPEMPAYRKGDQLGRVSAWYHAPDFRWGDSSKMGAIQFLRAPDGRLYYRVFGKKGLAAPGKELDTSDPDTKVKLPWGRMNMKMQVRAWLPNAVNQPSVMPVNIRPGAEPAKRYEPALRCTLTRDNEQKEFWVRMSRWPVPVRMGRRLFFARYRRASLPLSFSLQLKEAQQINDPGTDRPASYESRVALVRTEGNQEVRTHHKISMNNTLNHGQYKVYQTNYRVMTDTPTMRPMVDSSGKVVSMSGLTVAYDPGLGCKYVGSFLLVLGIATMFYMRTYFFQPSRRSSFNQATHELRNPKS